MRCITVGQPWAWALVHGTKRIENRTWATSYRGPLVIHAGKSRKFWTDPLPDRSRPPARDSIGYGVIVGVVDLLDCVPSTFDKIQDDPWRDPGGFCWLIGNPRPTQLIPFTGKMGFFDVPEKLLIFESARPSAKGSPASMFDREPAPEFAGP